MVYVSLLLLAAFSCFQIVGTQTLSQLTATVQTLQNKIVELEKKAAVSSSYCDLHVNGRCGPCQCFDDFELPQKYYCDCQNLQSKQDCLAFYQAGYRINGIYQINMNGVQKAQVYCDQTSQGGGWTVVQRRMDGSVNFYRNWTEYKHGFGKLHREFWLGNENIFLLTSVLSVLKGSEGMIELRLFSYSYNYYNRYSDFHIGNEAHQYPLHVDGYSGGYAPSYIFSYNNNAKFSTYDRDNDGSGSYDCAEKNHGGWWYNTNCDYYTNLNSIYDTTNKLGWQDKFNWNTYIEFSEIKVRRKL